MSNVDLQTYKKLQDIVLPPLALKPTSVTEGQAEASEVLWTSANGKVQMGIWECSPGRFASDHSDTSEIVHIISGEVELQRNDGELRRLGPGDALVLPRGWRGEWHIIQHVRKFWVVQYD